MDIPGYLLAAAALAASRYLFPGRIGYAILCLTMMAALPAAYIRFRGKKQADFLLASGDVGGGLRISAILLAIAMPIMYYGSTLPDFKAYYPTWQPAAANLWNFALYELYMLALMVATEVFYRGYLMNLLSEDTKYGNHIHAFIYMLAHVGKPPLEVIYSLPVGFIFGRVDAKYKSILPSLTMHYVSSVIFDLMVIYQAGKFLI